MDPATAIRAAEFLCIAISFIMEDGLDETIRSARGLEDYRNRADNFAMAGADVTALASARGVVVRRAGSAVADE